MNCLFCQKALIFNEAYYSAVYSEDTFQCLDCDTHYFIDKTTGKLIWYNFTGKIGETLVYLCFRRDNTFDIIKIGTTDRMLQLPYWPKLTPQNMGTKLKTWITFS